MACLVCVCGRWRRCRRCASDPVEAVPVVQKNGGAKCANVRECARLRNDSLIISHLHAVPTPRHPPWQATDPRCPRAILVLDTTHGTRTPLQPHTGHRPSPRPQLRPGAAVRLSSALLAARSWAATSSSARRCASTSGGSSSTCAGGWRAMRSKREAETLAYRGDVGEMWGRCGGDMGEI